jgi:TPR repeat protein
MAAMILSSPAAAQTQAPAQSSSSASAATDDGTTVTIFSTRHYSAATAQSEMAREHPEQGCMFKQQHDGYKHSSFTSSVGQASSGTMLGVGSPDSGTISPEDAAQSPDATDPGALMDQLDPCSTNGTLFTDPRNQILAHDKSLDKAFAAYDAGNYAEALPLFKASWNKIGYDMAGLMTGKMYLLGQGTPQDVNQAIYWFKMVVEKARNVTPSARHPEATIEQPFNPALPNYMSTKSEAAMYLARIYENGFKVAKDPKQARKYYMSADDFGFMPATHAVGEMYLSGYGGDTNVKEAIKHFTRAGTNGPVGYAPSQYALGEIYYFGEFGVPQDKMTAGAWLLKAAKGGNPDAQYAVARMYELGEGGASIDPARALAWYKAAAVNGQMDAETTLATYFYTGDGGVAKDLDTARKLFQAAANQGDPEAMFNLGVMMVNGEGGPKDVVKAYCWFSVANQSGLAKAGAAVRELSGKMTPEQRAQAEALLNPGTKTK